jgi:hypothetical protein
MEDAQCVVQGGILVKEEATQSFVHFVHSAIESESQLCSIPRCLVTTMYMSLHRKMVYWLMCLSGRSVENSRS